MLSDKQKRYVLNYLLTDLESDIPRSSRLEAGAYFGALKKLLTNDDMSTEQCCAEIRTLTNKFKDTNVITDTRLMIAADIINHNEVAVGDFFHALAGLNRSLSSFLGLEPKTCLYHNLVQALMANKQTEIVKTLFAARLLLVNGTFAFNLAALGECWLHIAMRLNDMEMVRVLLEAGADPMLSTNNWVSPLHYGFTHYYLGQNAEFNILKFLLAKGANLSQRDRDGNPIWHCNAYRFDISVFDVLRSAEGFDINARNALNQTILMMAVRFNNNGPWVTKLLQLGADIHVRDNEAKTILLRALSGQFVNQSVINSLLDAGSRLDDSDQDGKTAVHYLVSKKQVELLKTVIQRGARVDVVDRAGCAPIHLAAETGSKELMLPLVENRCDLNVKDHAGNTPLHKLLGNVSVSLDQRRSLTLWLVEAGADPFLSNEEGKTALSAANNAALAVNVIRTYAWWRRRDALMFRQQLSKSTADPRYPITVTVMHSAEPSTIPSRSAPTAGCGCLFNKH